MYKKIIIFGREQLKVVVSLIGRFHAFDLAEQLEKRGYLGKLVTTYPKMFIKRWKILKKNIQSLEELK